MARRAVVWSAVVVAVLALCSWAGAATNASPELSRIATEFRGGGVHETVYCSDSQADWSETLSRRHLPLYAVGFAYIGQPKVWLSPSVCAGIARVDPWAILVSEIVCNLPGCPPLETAVVFWEGETRHHFKLFKPVEEVAYDNLPYAWMKESLILPEGFGCECC